MCRGCPILLCICRYTGCYLALLHVGDHMYTLWPRHVTSCIHSFSVQKFPAPEREMSSAKVSHKQELKEQHTTYASEGSKDSCQSASSEKSKSKCKSKSDDCKTNWWPIIVFIILVIIIVIAMCACGGHNSYTDIGRGGLIGGAFLFFVIWLIVLWFFCSSGENTAAWFFVILIFAIIIAAAIASWIGRCAA